MSKKYIFILLFTLSAGASIQAQRNYLAFDYSISQFRNSHSKGTASGLSEKLSRYEGNYAGASYHLACGRKNYLSLGMCLSTILYQKEWQGTFPQSNQYGAASVNGQISYWSFPFSYTRTAASNHRGHYRNYHSAPQRFNFGFSITYTPSFKGRNSFSANTSGGADLNTFLLGFRSDEQSFQHSLTLALCDQLFLLNKAIRLDLEPYAGIGSSHFKEGGASLHTITYGLRIRIGLSVKLPNIRIEREADKGNAEEKKKLLEQKQKEIEEQLNKNPK